MAENGHVNPIQIQKFLKGVDYPVNKQDLIHYVEDQGNKGGEKADENVMETLKKLPEQEFETPADVSQAIGQIE